MRLCSINGIVNENLEKLIPSLKKTLVDYLANGYKYPIQIDVTGTVKWLPDHKNIIRNVSLGDTDFYSALLSRFSENYDLFGSMEQSGPNKTVNELITLVLNADPRYLAEKRKDKEPKFMKAPFAKYILNWWLSPSSQDGLKFPEDVMTIGEVIKIFNTAKKQGLNVDIAKISTYREMVDLIKPYMSTESANDDYIRMGFDKIVDEEGIRVYRIDKWIPGDASTLYPNTREHKAFQGLQWCVKYQTTFDSAYSPPLYYMVTVDGRRTALIHIESEQFKDPMDKKLFLTDRPMAIRIVNVVFKNEELLSKICNIIFEKCLDVGSTSFHYLVKEGADLTKASSRENIEALQNECLMIRLDRANTELIGPIKQCPDIVRLIALKSFGSPEVRKNAIKKGGKNCLFYYLSEGGLKNPEEFERLNPELTRAVLKFGMTSLIKRKRSGVEGINESPMIINQIDEMAFLNNTHDEKYAYNSIHNMIDRKIGTSLNRNKEIEELMGEILNQGDIINGNFLNKYITTLSKNSGIDLESLGDDSTLARAVAAYYNELIEIFFKSTLENPRVRALFTSKDSPELALSKVLGKNFKAIIDSTTFTKFFSERPVKLPMVLIPLGLGDILLSHNFDILLNKIINAAADKMESITNAYALGIGLAFKCEQMKSESEGAIQNNQNDISSYEKTAEMLLLGYVYESLKNDKAASDALLLQFISKKSKFNTALLRTLFIKRLDFKENHGMYDRFISALSDLMFENRDITAMYKMWLSDFRPKPWPAAEPYLKKDARYWAVYVRDVERHAKTKIGYAQENSEAAINKLMETTQDPMIAYKILAKKGVDDATWSGKEDVLQRLAEVLMKDLSVAITFASQFIGPWEDLENVLRERGSQEDIENYERAVLGGEKL